MIGNHVVALFGADFLFFVVRSGGYLEVRRSAEAIVEVAIDSPGHGRRKMVMSVSSTGNYYNRKFRIGKMRIRSEESYPTAAAAITGACLSRYCLQRIISLPTGAVVNCTDHARNHSLQDVAVYVQLSTHLWFELGGSVLRTRDLRHEQLSAVGHCRHEIAQLQGGNLEAVGIGKHATKSEAGTHLRQAAGKLKRNIRSGFFSQAHFARVVNHFVETDAATDAFEVAIVRTSKRRSQIHMRAIRRQRQLRRRNNIF